MNYLITDRNDLMNDDLRDVAERRMRFALSRFDDRISRVDLLVADENGPRGGIDKACRVIVGLQGAADVIVRGKDTDLLKCISRVAERAGRAVSRAISKKQSFDRTRPEMQTADPANPVAFGS